MEVRWIYTLFLVFAMIGHVSFILMAVYRVGPGYQEIVRHYLGAGDELAFPKEFIEIVEVTHFHAYIEGILLLVLTHLFVAAPISKRVKGWVIGVSFGSTLLDLLSPWAIRYISPVAAIGQLIAWAGMAFSYLPLTLIPLYFLWKKSSPSV